MTYLMCVRRKELWTLCDWCTAAKGMRVESTDLIEFHAVLRSGRRPRSPPRTHSIPQTRDKASAIRSISIVKRIYPLLQLSARTKPFLRTYNRSIDCIHKHRSGGRVNNTSDVKILYSNPIYYV